MNRKKIALIIVAASLLLATFAFVAIEAAVEGNFATIDRIKAHLLKYESTNDVSADVNGDGKLSVTDLLQLQKASNAYSEYVKTNADTAELPKLFLYELDADRIVAIKNGDAVGVYATQEEALTALIGEGTYDIDELKPTVDGKLFAYGDLPSSDDMQDPVSVFAYVSTMADTYITVSMTNATDDASQYFSIDKYQVVPGSKVRIQARIGAAAYCAWVDANGNRTKALQGPGGGSGWNTNRILSVPNNAIYLEVSYVTEYGLSVEEIDRSIQLIEHLGTTEQTYIKSDMSNAAPDGATPTYNIARYRVTPGCEVHIIARIGGSAYCAWVDAEGNRSKALQGNSNSGRNVNQLLVVPDGAVYLDVSYSVTQELYVGDPMNIYSLKIGLLGDSIAANGGFFNQINSVLGTTGKNVSIGGWFYSEDAGVDNEYPGDISKGIYRQVANLNGDENLIIIWAGTNDFGHSHRIGDINDRNPDTLYGGMHMVINALYDKLGEDITIILCTPLHRNMKDGGTPGYPYSSDQTNKLGNSLQAYWNAINDIAAYYDLLLFDAHAETGLDPRNEEINTKYFDDGLHPNAAGQTIIGNQLAKFIKENISQ